MGNKVKRRENKKEKGGSASETHERELIQIEYQDNVQHNTQHIFRNITRSKNLLVVCFLMKPSSSIPESSRP